jgi:hypothetical protein
MKITQSFGVAIATILIILTLYSPCVRADENCNLCGKPLSGKYFTFQKGANVVTVCQSCQDTLGHCMLCRIPVPGTKPGDLQVLCSDCRAQAKYCSVCGDLITGQYFASGDGKHVYCSKCESAAPRCAGCNDILRPRESNTEAGLKLCNQCFKNLPRCPACGMPVTGARITFSGLEGTYCQACTGSKPKCVSCGRPAGTGSISFGKDKYVCGLCEKTAVMDEKTLTELATKVRTTLDTQMGITLKPIPVTLSDDLGEYRLGNHLPAEYDNPDFRESGRYIQVNDTVQIIIQRGLARDLCIETLAHEYGHAWQMKHLPNLQDTVMQEGFAQWISSKILKYYKLYSLLARLETRKDPIYGDGYRAVHALEKQNTTSGMLEILYNKR